MENRPPLDSFFKQPLNKEFPRLNPSRASSLPPKTEVTPEVAQETEVAPGFIQSVAQGIASPFLRFGLTAKKLVEGAGALGRVSGAALTDGDSGGIAKEATDQMGKSADMGYLGDVRPIGFSEDGEPLPMGRAFADAGGVGLELGSYALGGGLGKETVKAGLKGAVGQGIKTGAKEGGRVGFTYGMGRALEGQALEENKSTIERMGEVALESIISGAAGTVFGGALGGTLAGGRAGLNTIAAKVSPQKALEQLDDTIVGQLEKGIRPSVAGKKSMGAIEKYNEQSAEAVKLITENKRFLKLQNEDGTVRSRLPTNLREFSDAITQTKSLFYKTYHNLAEQAGDRGARFSAVPATRKLNQVSQDKGFSPEVRRYAKELVEEIAELNGQRPSVIESRIAEMNSSLQGFYAGRVDRSKAQVDASVARLLREELDDIIDRGGGVGYQELKRQFGNLRSIEKDVVHRFIVDARKNTKGLPDLTDIFTGGQIVEGLLTLNPSQVARGGFGVAIKQLYKNINDPNKIIEKMFLNADEVIQRAVKAGVQIRPTPTQTVRPLLTAPAEGALRSQVFNQNTLVTPSGSPKVLPRGASQLGERVAAAEPVRAKIASEAQEKASAEALRIANSEQAADLLNNAMRYRSLEAFKKVVDSNPALKNKITSIGTTMEVLWKAALEKFRLMGARNPLKGK